MAIMFSQLYLFLVLLFIVIDTYDTLYSHNDIIKTFILQFIAPLL